MQIGKERTLPKAFHLLIFRNIVVYNIIGLLTYLQTLCLPELVETLLTQLQPLLEEGRNLVHFPVCLLWCEEEALLGRCPFIIFKLRGSVNGFVLKPRFLLACIVVHNVLMLFVFRRQLLAHSLAELLFRSKS